MTQINSNNVKIFVNDFEVPEYYVWSGDEPSLAYVDNITGRWIPYPEPWEHIPKILGDAKGVVSQEDRQLLKIVNTWNDEEVDNAIEQYIIEYKKSANKSKVYGKESWKDKRK